MMTPVGLWLLTLHLIGDFPLQPDWMAQRKVDEWQIRVLHCWIHAKLVWIMGVIALPTWGDAAILSAWVFASHFAIDSRRWFNPKDGWGETWVWLNDQILHLIALSLALPVVSLL